MTTPTTLTLLCIVDGASTSRAFPVNISPDDSMDDLKKLIKAKKAPRFDDVAADKLTLWRVSIPEDDDDEQPILLNKVSEKKKLKTTRELTEFFEGSLLKKTIHIIVQRPATTDIMDVIKKIQGALQPRDQVTDFVPHLPSAMPWQEPRESMKEAVTTVASNVVTYKASQGHLVAKPSSSFLVCSGAPGVGKTRYGYELYETLRHRLSEATKQRGDDFSPQYYRLLLNFSTDIYLGPGDADLSSDIILGLRMAYSHFVGRKYREGFEEFFRHASRHKDLFTISRVIYAIRDDLQLSDKQQQLFLFLHIDDFQRIFEYGWRGSPASVHRDVSLSDAGTSPTERHSLQGLRLFQDMMRMLGRFLIGETFPTM
ncbi:hypothetical protein DFQ27_000456, partial [Actinomortierella ambigua]